jgi:hypothetical protein
MLQPGAKKPSTAVPLPTSHPFNTTKFLKSVYYKYRFLVNKNLKMYETNKTKYLLKEPWLQ